MGLPYAPINSGQNCCRRCQCGADAPSRFSPAVQLWRGVFTEVGRYLGSTRNGVTLGCDLELVCKGEDLVSTSIVYATRYLVYIYTTSSCHYSQYIRSASSNKAQLPVLIRRTIFGRGLKPQLRSFRCVSDEAPIPYVRSIP